MFEKPTNELNEYLEKIKPTQITEYYQENKQNVTDAKKAFYYYMKDVLGEKRIYLKDIYIGAGVSESYGEKILTMEKHTKNRDLIIRFCLAGHFQLDEVNRALKLYGMAPLYAKDRRDACIIVAIHNRIYELSEIDNLLEAHNLKKISFEK